MKHRIPYDLHSLYIEGLDPGNAGTITVDRDLVCYNLVSAAAETRTLARPTKTGVYVAVMMKTDGGDITMTVTGGYNLAGATAYTFTDAGQVAEFISWFDGTNYAWRLLGPAAAAVPAEVLSTARTVRAEESGKTFYLNLAGGFVVTLPAPALGLRFTFIVSTAPTTSYTVVTAASANVMLGHIVTSQDAGGSGDSETSGGDTFSFVANQAVVGDRADFESDGTSWFVRGTCKVVAGETITTAS